MFGYVREWRRLVPDAAVSVVRWLYTPARWEWVNQLQRGTNLVS